MCIVYLQKCRLLMNAEDHEYHHVHPETDYCYFCPLTNWFLRSIGFWDGMRAFYKLNGVDAVLPQAMTANHDHKQEHVKN